MNECKKKGNDWMKKVCEDQLHYLQITEEYKTKTYNLYLYKFVDGWKSEIQWI